MCRHAQAFQVPLPLKTEPETDPQRSMSCPAVRSSVSATILSPFIHTDFGKFHRAARKMKRIKTAVQQFFAAGKCPRSDMTLLMRKFIHGTPSVLRRCDRTFFADKKTRHIAPPQRCAGALTSPASIPLDEALKTSYNCLVCANTASDCRSPRFAAFDGKRFFELKASPETVSVAAEVV